MQNILEYYLEPFRKYATFSGRATRRELLAFTIINSVIYYMLWALDQRLPWYFPALDAGVLSLGFALAIFLPDLALNSRRLHDSNLSAWWMLAFMLPVVGWLIAFIVLLQNPTPGENRFGPDPRGEIVVEMPEDGGPPFALSRRRFVACPWCLRSNPPGRSDCQWCHKPYRDCETPA